MSKYYKAEDVIKAIEEIRAIDIEVKEYTDKNEAFMKGYAKGSVEGYILGRASIEVNKDTISREWIKNALLKYGFTAPDMTVTELIDDTPSVIPKTQIETQNSNLTFGINIDCFDTCTHAYSEVCDECYKNNKYNAMKGADDD